METVRNENSPALPQTYKIRNTAGGRGGVPGVCVLISPPGDSDLVEALYVIQTGALLRVKWSPITE